MVQLKKKVGEQVLVAAKEGSIEFHKGSIVEQSDTTVNIVLESPLGAKVVLDKRSNRLWHGTIDSVAWEVSPCASHGINLHQSLHFIFSARTAYA